MGSSHETVMCSPVDRWSSESPVLHHENIYRCICFLRRVESSVMFVQGCAVGVLWSGPRAGVWTWVGARLVIVVSTGVDDEGDRCDQDTAAVQGTESAQ